VTNSNRFLRRYWAIASLLVILALGLFATGIIASKDTLQVQYTPDDAYYYLVLARNFASSGSWTFDSGHSLTSGFHPLWAYALVAVNLLSTPALGEFVLYGLVISSGLTIATLLIAWRLGFEFHRPYYLVVFALLASTKNVVYNSVSAVEWPLAILLISLYCIQFWRGSLKGRSALLALSLFLLGFAGSVNRTDFGLLPFSILVTSLMLHFYAADKRSVVAALWGFGGAVTGVLFALGHSYLLSGEFLQSSARMKSHWGQVYGSNYLGVRQMLTQLVGLEGALLLLAIAVAAVAMLLQGQRKNLPREADILKTVESRRGMILVVASAISLVGYSLYYAYNAEIQPWYSANLLVPIFLLFLGGFLFVDHVLQKRSVAIGLSLVATLIVIKNLVGIYPISEANAPWPHQRAMMAAGKYLAHEELEGSVGAWNAGIISYYEGGHVINLDGLTNNDIYEYAVAHRLPDYIESSNIRYVIDFEATLNHPYFQLRGGYDDPEFIERLSPVTTFSDREYLAGHLTLYRIQP
jgi:hypothetical protein